MANLEPSLLSISLPLDSYEAAKIIVWALTRFLFDHQKIPRVKRFHLRQLAGPINSEQQTPPIKIDWFIVVKAVK